MSSAARDRVMASFNVLGFYISTALRIYGLSPWINLCVSSSSVAVSICDVIISNDSMYYYTLLIYFSANKASLAFRVSSMTPNY